MANGINCVREIHSLIILESTVSKGQRTTQTALKSWWKMYYELKIYKILSDFFEKSELRDWLRKNELQVEKQKL